jgi:hypothetical protein
VKVNIYETVEVSDEQRIAIAAEIDGDGGKRRQATRDEIKSFIWTEGRNWASVLTGDGEPEAEAEPEDDLLGDDEDLLG